MELDVVNQNDMSNEDSTEQFIVRRTEIADIIHFTSESLEGPKVFGQIFGDFDLEMIFETSLFPITIYDTNNTSYVGLFIFNDTPFGALRREGFPNTGGIWENWFLSQYEDIKLDGKNSLWLVYCCLNENYCISEEVMRKIYHKIHLSLFTTLSHITGVFVLLSKSTYKEISDAEDSKPNEDLDHLSKSMQINPFHCLKVLLSYLYKLLPDLDEGSSKEHFDLCVLLNMRDTVFPLIEIRLGTQEDHDDLENIFKDQTPPEVANNYEEFFIAKMIADEDPRNKVLVGQVNDKAIGMLAVSTDLNVEKLAQSFELEAYDNLLKQDYMKAVKLRRKQIRDKLLEQEEQEHKDLVRRFNQEVKCCETVSQRILLQEYVNRNFDRYFLKLEDLEKKIKKPTEKEALGVFKINLTEFELRYPNLDEFYGKVKIDSGNCLLIDKLSFFLETLEFFDLPKGYIHGEGHWENYIKSLEKKRAIKEAFKKQMQKEGKSAAKKTGGKKAQKANDELVKPSHFDFEPMDTSLTKFRRADMNVRSSLRMLIRANKQKIASFFVNEQEEPSELRCFDLLLLPKMLRDNKIDFEEDHQDLFAAILICFGNLQYDRVEVMRVPEQEKKQEEKIDKKKKPKDKKKGKEVLEEKKSIKPIAFTALLISIIEFFNSVEVSFEYDKILHEAGLVSSDVFRAEYEIYLNEQREIEEKKRHREISEFERIYNEQESLNLQESERQLEAYSSHLEGYSNYEELPPMPPDVLNAFCVRLYFIEQAFESRSTDFLLQAFDSFPDKDYLVVTQPYTYSENSLISETFLKIGKKVDSFFPDMLYIIHRESLMISLLNVDYCRMEDLERGIYLFENLGRDANYMYKICTEAITDKACKFQCIAVKINENVIGLSLISKEINIDYYDSHFTIRDFINLDKVSKYYHGRLLFFAVHKNFTQHNKLIFKEIARLLNKFALYFELYTDVKYPRFVDDMVMCRNRHFPHFELKKWDYEREYFEDDKIRTRMDGEERDEIDEEESEFCLMLITRKMLSDFRIANNSRIVVIGASDTGTSFIESLLSIRYLRFSNIYLVAPGGLQYHHIKSEILNLRVSYTNYKMAELRKLLLENRIKIINSKMVQMNRDSKYVKLADGSALTYDYLILTLGLQDTLWYELSNNVVNVQIEEKFGELVKEKEKEIEELNNLQNQQNNQAKEEKDIKKEKNNLMKDIEQIRANKNNLLSQLNFISIDDPNIYEIFNPNTKLMKSLRKNPLYKLILYGRSINLLCFIQGMLARGIEGKKMKLVIPDIYHHYVFKDDKGNWKKDIESKKCELEFINTSTLESTPEIEEYLFKVIKENGIEVYKDYNYEDVVYNDSYDSIEAFRFTNEETADSIEIKGNYFITGGLIDVDRSVFNFIHENGLVYNGRSIIKGNFMTADPCIFAAGRLCEFSSRYSYKDKGKLLRLERY